MNERPDQSIKTVRNGGPSTQLVFNEGEVIMRPSIWRAGHDHGIGPGPLAALILSALVGVLSMAPAAAENSGNENNNNHNNNDNNNQKLVPKKINIYKQVF